MKTFAFLFIMTLGFTNAFSQDYYPIVQENNEWNILQVVYPGSGNPWDTIYWTISYKFTGDTIISDQAYKKVYKSEEEIPINWEYEGCIREEEQKVWYFPKYGNGETKIYDFTVNMGDTISFLYQPMVVDSISYKEINGEDRKHFYFSYIDFSPFKEIWIEGIGSNYGVLSSGNGMTLGGWTWFLCMSENGELIYMNPNYNSCLLISTGTKETINPEINIFPNPTNNILIVENLSHALLKSIKLVDLKGNIIKEFSTDQENLNLNGIKPGSYIICDGFTPGLSKGISSHEDVILNLSKGIVCPNDAIVSYKDTIPHHKDDTPSHKAAIPSHEDTVPQPKDANVPYKDNVPQHEDTIPPPEDIILSLSKDTPQP